MNYLVYFLLFKIFIVYFIDVIVFIITLNNTCDLMESEKKYDIFDPNNNYFYKYLIFIEYL